MLFEFWNTVTRGDLVPYLALGMIAVLLLSSGVRLRGRSDQTSSSRHAHHPEQTNKYQVSDHDLQQAFQDVSYQLASLNVICQQMQGELSDLRRSPDPDGTQTSGDVVYALAILGIDPGRYPDDLTLDEVKKAFRSLAKIHHPDTGADGVAMKQLTDAYDLLKNKFAKNG